MNQKESETLSSSQPFYTQQNIKVLHLYSGGGRITGRALVSDTGDSSGQLRVERIKLLFTASGDNYQNTENTMAIVSASAAPNTDVVSADTETSVTDERRAKKKKSIMPR